MPGPFDPSQPDPQNAQMQKQYQDMVNRLNGLVDNGQIKTYGPGTHPAASTDNPYGFDYSQSKYEQQAGVSAPDFYSMLGKDGSLKGQYQVDPNKSSAFQQMAGIAQSKDLSPWAQMQMQSNHNSAAQQRDAASAGALGGTDQAMQQLMSTGGGTNSGSALFLAEQGARNNMMANQQVYGQEQQNALGIQGQDAQNKQNLLGQVANTQTGALAANAQLAMQDTQNANLFNTNRYHEQMQAWGADKTAQGQAAAANSGGGGKK